MKPAQLPLFPLFTTRDFAKPETYRELARGARQRGEVKVAELLEASAVIAETSRSTAGPAATSGVQP